VVPGAGLEGAQRVQMHGQGHDAMDFLCGWRTLSRLSGVPCSSKVHSTRAGHLHKRPASSIDFLGMNLPPLLKEFENG
jgi:hypothetical protein